MQFARCHSVYFGVVCGKQVRDETLCVLIIVGT